MKVTFSTRCGSSAFLLCDFPSLWLIGDCDVSRNQVSGGGFGTVDIVCCGKGMANKGTEAEGMLRLLTKPVPMLRNGFCGSKLIIRK